MASRPRGGGRKDSALDAGRGRSDGSAELRRHLPVAPPAYLGGALDNPVFAEEDLVLLLRNRSATPAVLSRIGRDRRWSRSYEVKKGIVRHPRTPLPMARAFLSHLYWRDLAEIAEDARMHPSVRRHAEEVLTVRLEEMTQGEKITLARRASRGLIAALRESREARVLEALLGNGRLLEHDAVRIATSARAPREALAALAEHPDWGCRYSIRLSLINNPRTPVPVALRLMDGLPRQDLQRLARDAGAPKIVRVGADRRLDGPSGPGRSRRRG